MTYSTREKSVKDGAPVEWYKFTSAFGTFLYTNNNEPLVIGSETYDPLNITRSAIEISSDLGSINTVDVTVPVNCQLAALYCFLKSPDELLVTIRRGHRGDDLSTQYKQKWTGVAVGSSVAENYATINTGSLIQSRLSGSMGSQLYQRSCNHALYDSRCKVNPASFTVAATVTKVQGARIFLDSDGAANNALRRGKMTVDRTGEFRSIVDNVNNLVTVTSSFIDIQKGDTVTVLHGCDHARLGDCKNKFNNVVNYGGMDFVPTVNPFTDLAAKNEAQITTKTNTELNWLRTTPSHWEYYL